VRQDTPLDEDKQWQQPATCRPALLKEIRVLTHQVRKGRGVGDKLILFFSAIGTLISLAHATFP